MAVKLFYVGNSSNSKTGNIVQQFIGGTREESKKTCTGCPLLDNHHCYAQYRSEAWAHTWLIKKQKEKDYTLKGALKKRDPKSRYIRLGSIGDPSAIKLDNYLRIVAQAKKVGLGILSYTHFWKSRGSHLRGLALASCDSWDSALEAVKKKWRATIWVEKDFIQKNGNKGKVNGVKFAQCPYQTHGTTCNKCGLCDPTKDYLVPIIVFQRH